MSLLVMGVLNVTPDSFSDGGLWASTDSAIAHGRDLISQGADVIDIGGESTRPGAEPVSISDEIARIVPVVEALSSHVRVSIDTRHGEVALAAVERGATLINDVSASLWPVAAELGVGWVAMHMQGEPQTMQTEPKYDNVVSEVADFLFGRAEAAKHGGVGEIWIDPGIGFGKTTEHNLSLLKHLDVLTESPFSVVVGTSRKTFLGRLTEAGHGAPPPQDRLEASLATALVAATKGARMVRVHDVRATVRAARVLTAVEEAA